jgi:Rrf2 family protein
MNDGDVMRLQISTRLAIFAVLELAAREGHQLSVAEIGEKYGVSNHHLAKVMHVMGRAGFVRSARGARGGYQFAGNARRMTLMDVVQLFEDLNSADQQANVADATAEGQALHQVLSEIDDIARATLGSITIATMCKLVNRPGGRGKHRPKPVALRQRNRAPPQRRAERLIRMHRRSQLTSLPRG